MLVITGWHKALTIGLWIGVVANVLKGLDLFISDDSKKKFNGWIDALTLWLSYVTVDSMYQKLRQKKVHQKLFLLISSVPILIVFAMTATILLDPVTYNTVGELLSEMSVPLLIAVVVTILQFWILMRAGPWLFQAATLGDAFRKLRFLWFLYVGNFAIVGIGLILGYWGLLGKHPTMLRVADIYIWIEIIPVFFLTVIFATFGTCHIIFASLLLLRYPIKYLQSLFWWIADYPKGAWVASVLALTVVLGILKALT